MKRFAAHVIMFPVNVAIVLFLILFAIMLGIMSLFVWAMNTLNDDASHYGQSPF